MRRTRIPQRQGPSKRMWPRTRRPPFGGAKLRRQSFPHNQSHCLSHLRIAPSSKHEVCEARAKLMTKKRQRILPPNPGSLIILLLKTPSPFLVAMLQRYGYAVAEARSTDHLVALCLSNSVRAVIMDEFGLGEAE